MNLSRVPRVVSKNMVVGHVMPHPERVVALFEEVLHADAELPETPTPPGARPKDSWREEIPLDHLPESLRERVYEMLSTHRQMWDGSLDTIEAAQHRIDMIPGSRPFYAHPYRAGHRSREAEAA